MKSNHLAGRVLLLVVVSSAMLLTRNAFCAAPRQTGAEGRPTAAARHRVVAYYFHRTQRCPTCKRISAYTEEAIRGRFAEQIKRGQVALYLIDFQNPRNQQYTKYYKIEGPTLVLIDTRGKKITAWKTLPEVWTLVFNKEEFFRYVQDGVRSYLEAK